MSFMQKNVNMFLLLLILVVAGTLAGSAVYYQANFDKLTDKHDDAAANLSECRADLEKYMFNLNKTMRTLNSTTQDIKRYDELYSNKSAELKSTQDTLSQTDTELKSTKITLQEEISLKNKYKSDYNDQVQINRNLEEQKTLLTAQKAQCETSLSSCRASEEDAQDCIQAYLSDYDAALTQQMKDDLEECEP